MKINEDKLKIGTRIKFGKEYAKHANVIEGDIIELVEGRFEHFNGLYTEIQFAPSVYDNEAGEFESIYHLFGNDLEYWLDCEIIEPHIDNSVINGVLVQNIGKFHIDIQDSLNNAKINYNETVHLCRNFDLEDIIGNAKIGKENGNLIAELNVMKEYVEELNIFKPLLEVGIAGEAKIENKIITEFKIRNVSLKLKKDDSERKSN